MFYVKINGQTYKAIKTAECDDDYTEYEVFKEEDKLGKVTRLGAEILFSAWDNDGNLIDMKRTAREAVAAFAQ